MILAELLFSFVQIGLFSVGGGYAAIPLIREQTVTLHGWLTAEEFMHLAAIAEMTPGPIAINGATFAGLKVAGLPGALAATLGCILPSLVIVSVLATLYRRCREMPMLQGILAALRPAVAALIASAGLSMLLQVALGSGGAAGGIHWGGLVLFTAALLALRKLKWSPILVMALCGAAGLCLGLLGLG